MSFHLNIPCPQTVKQEKSEIIIIIFRNPIYLQATQQFTTNTPTYCLKVHKRMNELTLNLDFWSLVSIYFDILE